MYYDSIKRGLEETLSQPPKDKLRVEGILMVTLQPDQVVNHSRSEH